MLVYKRDQVIWIPYSVGAVGCNRTVKSIGDHMLKFSLKVFAFLGVKEISSFLDCWHRQTTTFGCFGFLVSFLPLSLDISCLLSTNPLLICWFSYLSLYAKF